MLRCGLLRSNFCFAMVILGGSLVGGLLRCAGSGGRTRTHDTTIMSRVLLPSELRRQESPLSESNRRHSPYHGDALPTELRGLVPADDVTGRRSARLKLKLRDLQVETSFMRFQRLLLEAGPNTVTVDLHPRLTVIAGVGELERESLVAELLAGLAGSRPGTHVEV